MASLKAHEVDRFLTRTPVPVHLFMIYGPDSGLVRERGRALAQSFSSERGGGFNLVSLDMSEIEKDLDRLAVEARTSSLFGGAPVVRVRNASKSVLPAVEALLADWPGAPIIIEAGNLTPKDKLRSLVEKSPIGMAIPCYADSNEDRMRLIADTMNEHQIAMDPDAQARLRDLLGNDREVTRRELEKLVLFAAESKTITTEDVDLLCGDNAATTIDQIVDAVGTGHLQNLEAGLANAETMGVDAQRILLASLNHFKWLREKIVQAESSRRRVIDVMNDGWPKPHFSRRSALEMQGRLWSDTSLQQANARLYETLLLSRKQADIADSAVSRVLFSLAVRASKR